MRLGHFMIINSYKYEKMPIRIFCRNRKRGFCNTVQNLAIKLPSAMTSNFPCVNSKKNTFSNGNVCHFKFCYNMINQFCNTVQNLANQIAVGNYCNFVLLLAPFMRRQFGAEYLVFVSSRSLKTREKYTN